MSPPAHASASTPPAGAVAAPITAAASEAAASARAGTPPPTAASTAGAATPPPAAASTAASAATSSTEETATTGQVGATEDGAAAPAAGVAPSSQIPADAPAIAPDQAATGSGAPADAAAEATPDGDATTTDPSRAAVELASQALAAFMAAFVAMASQIVSTAEQTTADQPTVDPATPAIAATGAGAAPVSIDLAATETALPDRPVRPAVAAGELNPASVATASTTGADRVDPIGAQDLASLVAELFGAEGESDESASLTSLLAAGADDASKTDQLVSLLTAIAGGSEGAPSRPDAAASAEQLAAIVAQLGGVAKPAADDPTPARTIESVPAASATTANGQLATLDLAASAVQIARALTASAGVATPATSATQPLSPRVSNLQEVVAAAQSLAAVAEAGQQLKLASVSGSSRVTVQLDPEQLGAVRLDVQRREGGVSLQVSVETAAGRQVVEANLDEIRGALQAAGIELDDVQVSGPRAAIAPAVEAQSVEPAPATAAPRPSSGVEVTASEVETGEAPARASEGAAADQAGGVANVTPTAVASGPAAPTGVPPTAGAAPGRAEGLQLVKDIAQQIGLLGGQGKSDFQLQLNPESLGRLHVRLTMEDGAMTVRMTAQSSEARSAIEQNLGQLRQSFQEQGIRVDRFVVVAGQAQFGQDNQHPRRSRGWVDQHRSARQSDGEGDFAQALAAVGASRSLDYRA